MSQKRLQLLPDQICEAIELAKLLGNCLIPPGKEYILLLQFACS